MALSKLGVAIFFALVTTSCATINPYVLQYEATPIDTGGTPINSCTTSEHDSVCKLRRFQGELGRKLKEHTVMGAVSGSLLLPLASIIAYKGATGAGTHNIAALSSGGFAGYGTVQYLYKRPRELIYVSGIGALDCAIRVSQPYLWKKDEARYENANHAIQSLKFQAESFMRNYRSDRSNLLGLALLSAGDVMSAKLQLAQARTARRRSISDQYEAEMIAAAYRIIAEVNKQLALLAPDPESLQSKLGGLALPVALTEPEEPPPASDAPESRAFEQYASSLKQEIEQDLRRLDKLKARSNKLEEQIEIEMAPTTSDPHGSNALKRQEEMSQVKNLSKSVENSLTAKRQELSDLEVLMLKRDEAVMRVVAVEMDTPPTIRPLEPIDFADCGIDKPSGLIESTMEAHPITLKLDKSATATIYITGGVGDVAASVASRPAGEPSDAFTVSIKQLGPGMAEITLTSTDMFKTGSHAVLARDAAGGVELIPVQGQ